MSATALWFGPRSRPLFGWLHKPGGVSPQAAVVLCPPLGLEQYNAHYAFLMLAGQLEAAGIMVVRFDYDGTGDSAGSALDPARTEAWIQSIEHAAELARSHGASSISLVGLRMGALLAEFAAPRITDLGATVLWDPCVTARVFVRQQRALERLRLTSEPETAPYDGSPGGLIDARTLDELKRLGDPPALARASAPTLLLHRQEDTTIEKLAQRLDRARTTLVSIEGQRPFLDEVTLARIVPTATLTRISQWLTEQLAPPPSPQLARGDERTLADRAAAGVPRTWGFSEAEGVVTAQSDCGPVTERVLKLGQIGLFGIETRAERVDSSLPTVLFLNSSKDGRTGPNRIWVRVAREWAGLGFRCVRFDFSGLADSPARPGRDPDVAGAPEAFDDLAEVVEAISPEDPSNVIMVGLCSGGYQAFESGLTLKPRAILAVNPQLAFPPPEMRHGPIDPRRQICLPTTSASVDVYRELVPAWLRAPLRPLVWRGRRMLASAQSRSQWIDVLIDNGVDVLCVCGPDDLHQLPERAQRSLPTTASGGSLRVEVIDNLQHALLPPSDQDQVTERLTGHLLANFPPDPARMAQNRQVELVL
jgi:pimeloyl-ACP methyl ester carboxylesterase